MSNAGRYRRPEQLFLYQPPRILPVWENLPPQIRQTVTKLLVKMLRDHQMHRTLTREKGAADDE